MNARLLTFYFQRISSCLQGGWFAYEPRYLRRIPVCIPDSATAEGRERAEQLRQHADELTRLHLRVSTAQTSREADGLMREKAVCENRVDRLVYDLYGRTDAEIALVEEGVPPA